jgi:hypothetical protein
LIGHSLQRDVCLPTAVVSRQLIAGDAKQPPAKGPRRAQLIQVGQRLLKGGRGQVLGQRLVVPRKRIKLRTRGRYSR